jgi:hypothetical protein
MVRMTAVVVCVWFGGFAAGCGGVENGGKCGFDKQCKSDICGCDNRCTSLGPKDDSNNCGGCGKRCNPGYSSCRGGQCTCDPGRESCGTSDSCINLADDERHCGACGKVCRPDQDCVGGACVCRFAGEVSCFEPPICVSLTTGNNCGACGRACGDGQRCVTDQSGGATCQCDVGRDLCPVAGGSPMCIDIKYDDKNCGGCAQPCAPLKTCVDGTCFDKCPFDQTMCNPLSSSNSGNRCCSQAQVCYDGDRCSTKCRDDSDCGGDIPRCETASGRCMPR